MMVKDWITEKDGVAYCPVRLVFVITLFLYFFFTALAAVHEHFEWMAHAKDWAEGASCLIGAGGLAVTGKALTEKVDA